MCDHEMSWSRAVSLPPVLQGVLWRSVTKPQIVTTGIGHSWFSFYPCQEKCPREGTQLLPLCITTWGVTGTEPASKKMSQLVYRHIGCSVSCNALLVRVCEQEPNLELRFPFELVTFDKIPHAFPFRQISSQLQPLALELKIYNH